MAHQYKKKNTKKKKKKKKTTKNNHSTRIAIEVSFHIKAVEVICSIYNAPIPIHFSPSSLDLARCHQHCTPCRPVEGAYVIYSWYRCPEMMVVSSLIPPLQPFEAFARFSTKSNIAETHPGINRNRCRLTS